MEIVNILINWKIQTTGEIKILGDINKLKPNFPFLKSFNNIKPEW